MMRGPPAQGSSFKFGANIPQNMNSKSFGASWPAHQITYSSCKLLLMRARAACNANALCNFFAHSDWRSRAPVAEISPGLRQADFQTHRYTTTASTHIHDEPNGGQIRQDNFLYVAARSAAHRRRRWGPLGSPAPGDPSLHLTAGTRMF